MYYVSLKRKKPKLTENKTNLLEGLITPDETSRLITTTQNEKKPKDQRNDGLLKQHTLIWKQLTELFVVRSLNEGVAEGEMSISQREGIGYND